MSRGFEAEDGGGKGGAELAPHSKPLLWRVADGRPAVPGIPLRDTRGCKGLAKMDTKQYDNDWSEPAELAAGRTTLRFQTLQSSLWLFLLRCNTYCGRLFDSGVNLGDFLLSSLLRRSGDSALYLSRGYMLGRLHLEISSTALTHGKFLNYNHNKNTQKDSLVPSFFSG